MTAHIPVWDLSVWVFARVWALNGLYEVMSGGCWLGGLRYQLSTHSNHSAHVMGPITTLTTRGSKAKPDAEASCWNMLQNIFLMFKKNTCWVIMDLIQLDKIVWSQQSPHLISLELVFVSAVTFLTMLCYDNETPLHSPLAPNGDLMWWLSASVQILRGFYSTKYSQYLANPLHCTFRFTPYIFCNSPPCSEVATLWSEFWKYIRSTFLDK